MKLKTTLIAMVIVFCANQFLYAQDALWQLDFEKEIEWTKITEVGILLVGCSDMVIHGIDSRDGNKLWENDIMKGAKAIRGADGKKQEPKTLFETYVRVLEDSEVPEMSDFIEVKFTDNALTKNFAIINIQTGEEITSPEKAGMPISKWFGKEMASFNHNGSGFVPGAGGAIISANWIDYMQKGQPEMKLTKFVNLPSGEVRWETDQVGLNVLPTQANDGNFILPGNDRIAKVNSKTGEIIWSYEVSEKKQTFEKFDFSLDLTTGYFFEKKKNNGELAAIDLKSGNKLWGVEYKLKEIPQMFSLNDGVVVVDSKYFSFYDLKSGAVKWESKIKDINYVVDVGDNGIAVAAKDKRLLLIDRSNGEILWDEKIKGINIDQMIAKGIMYTDAKGRLGIITYDGQKVWDNKGMLETPSARNRVDYKTEWMYADGDLYKVDLVEGTYEVLIGKVDKMFEGDEVPNKIEVLDEGTLLSSSNNLMMLDENGKVLWKKYWTAPEMSLAAKIALRVGQVAAYTAAYAASARSAAYKTYGTMPSDNYYSKMWAEQADDWNNIAGMAGAEARKKFTATVSKGKYQIILARVGQGGQGKSSGFVKVDKTTGEELASIQLGDKEPVYDFDPFSGQIFHKSTKKQIISYSL
jgi:hypothetical protein